MMWMLATLLIIIIIIIAGIPRNHMDGLYINRCHVDF